MSTLRLLSGVRKEVKFRSFPENATTNVVNKCSPEVSTIYSLSLHLYFIFTFIFPHRFRRGSPSPPPLHLHTTSSILTRLTSPAAYASPSFCRYRPTRTSTSSSIDLDAGSPSPAAFYHSIRHVSVSRLDRLVGREQRPRRCSRPRLICHAASAPTVFCTLVGLYVLSVWFPLLVPSLIVPV